MEPDDFPRGKPGDLVKALAKEDLDPLSVAELDQRIVALEAEIERTRAKRDKASAFRSAAESLFGKS